MAKRAASQPSADEPNTTTNSMEGKEGTQILQEQPPLFDLGRVSRSKSKKLKEGRGSLMHEIDQIVQQVHSTVAHEGEHHPVIISYEKKKKRSKFFGMKVNLKKMRKRRRKRLRKLFGG